MPVKRDWSKAPAIPTWKEYQREFPTADHLAEWFDVDHPPGIGILSGAISGGLECIDFDRHAEQVFALWRDMAGGEVPGILGRLNVVRTPSGGCHVRYRVKDFEVPGSLKLAQEVNPDFRPDAPPGERGARHLTLIETRGEGGYALAPGSPPECHKTGRTYVHAAGPPLTRLGTVTAEERAVLIRCAEILDRLPAEEPPAPRPARPARAEGDGVRPGDDYDQRGPDWSDILAPHGWTLAHRRGNVACWTRPGKTFGVSATTGYCRGPKGEPLLKVFTTNAHPFDEGKAYGRFRAYALLEHGGHFGEAARALGQQGYGTQHKKAEGAKPAAHVEPVGHDGAAQQVGAATADEEQVGWQFRTISSWELENETAKPEWIVKRLFVKGQPCVIGAPQKAGKTCISIDLAISLSTGTPFLSHFDVYKPLKVAMLSGESGRWTIMNVAKQVCRARGLTLGQTGVRWGFDLPNLADAAHLGRLRKGIREDGIEVLIVDPLYLCLLSGGTEVQASNLYQMGPLLLAVARACLSEGATPFLLHHANRPAGVKRDPLELGDLAFSGISEFARQWVLLNRREAFTPGEPGKLWMSVGGSAGQSGIWSLDIDEGELDDDFQGRRWSVKVDTAGNEIERKKADRESRKRDEERQTKHERQSLFLRALDAIDPKGNGTSLNAVRDQMVAISGKGMNGTTFNALVASLTLEGFIEKTPVKAARGRKGKTEVDVDGVRRVRDAAECGWTLDQSDLSDNQSDTAGVR